MGLTHRVHRHRPAMVTRQEAVANSPWKHFKELNVRLDFQAPKAAAGTMQLAGIPRVSRPPPPSPRGVLQKEKPRKPKSKRSESNKRERLVSMRKSNAIPVFCKLRLANHVRGPRLRSDFLRNKTLLCFQPLVHVVRGKTHQTPEPRSAVLRSLTMTVANGRAASCKRGHRRFDVASRVMFKCGDTLAELRCH